MRSLPVVLTTLLALAGCDADAPVQPVMDMAVQLDFSGSADFSRPPAPDLGRDMTSPFPSHCTSGGRDDDETDVDCGGSCPPCAAHQGCATGADCTTAFCRANVCAVGFAAPQAFTAGMAPAGVVVGDWNLDGKADVAVANSGSDDVSILLGNGDGTLAKAVSVAAPGLPAGIAAVDLNHDGSLDLLVLVDGNKAIKGGVDVLIGDGKGGFKAAVNYPTGALPRAIVTGDWKNSKAVDAVVVDSFSGDIAYLAGNGNGTFAPARTVTTAGQSTGLAAGDWNGDGTLDVVVGNTDLYLHLGDGSGGFAPFRRIAGGSGGDRCPVVAGDWNGDGKLDAALGGSSKLAIFTGTGMGSFDVAARAAPDAILALVTADWDRDGKIDIAAATTSSVGVLPGKGDGTFPLWATFAAGTSPRALAAGDLDGDGHADLVVALGQSNQVAVLLNAIP